MNGPGTTLFTGGLVVLPDREPTICDIAVRDGRIVSVGAFDATDGPVERIDMSASRFCRA